MNDMQPVFSKRILNFSDFVHYSFEMILSTPKLLSATFINGIPGPLQEKILLSTTSVNRCVLCARFASEMAFSGGVSQEEVLSILNMDLSETNKCRGDEMVALLYAQNYAESSRNPDPALVKRLYDTYGADMAPKIEAVTMKSNYYNLMGNTFSAFVSRLKGAKAPGSSLLFEIFFAIIVSPVVVPSWLFVFARKNRFRF